jgi:hypothetical protein
MGVPPTLVRVLVGRFGEVASPEAARSMSVEQVEAALELDSRGVSASSAWVRAILLS